jgi:hypothetical protein
VVHFQDKVDVMEFFCAREVDGRRWWSGAGHCGDGVVPTGISGTMSKQRRADARAWRIA